MATGRFPERVKESAAKIIATLHRASAAHQAGNLVEAEALYNSILRIDKKHFAASLMLGLLNAQRGNYVEAEALLRSALRVNPQDPACQFNYGNVLIALQRYDEALAAFEKTLELNPGFAGAQLNRGGILMMQKRFDEAIACFDAAIGINPGLGSAYCNRGSALEELRRFEDALASHDRALTLEPNNAEFHASRANALHRMKRYNEAVSAIGAALTNQPGNAAFHYNKGNIFFELNRYVEAYASYDAAFRLNADLNYIEGDRYFAKRMICDWGGLDAETAHLISGIASGRPSSRPFPFLSAGALTPDQTKCATAFIETEFPPVKPLWLGERYVHERIKVGYLSADFREHATSHLLAGMIEHHDCQRFETIAVSFGENDATPMRRRMECAFERFVDVSGKSDIEIARWMRAAEIDIAVDLMGPTQNARPAILAYRPAPVQIGYLGFPGCGGAPYIDYILGDHTVIPEGEQNLFREQVVYLPDTYQVNDDRRPISEYTPTRRECFLPETGFVFCCFNKPYKIAPDVFNIWMTLLNEIEGSVLWMFEGNSGAITNLRCEAENRGVAPERLIFAPKMPLSEHLARHRQADLFLDTLPYNAHTTASDALWAGLPVLTCRGPTFAGRVAASLLKAVGLDDLVTGSLKDYEALALKLAHDPSRLASIKNRLARNRNIQPLFNTARFTRHLESALMSMHDRLQRGLPPASFAVEHVE